MEWQLIIAYTIIFMIYGGTLLISIWSLLLIVNYLFGDIIERKLEVINLKHKWKKELKMINDFEE